MTWSFPIGRLFGSEIRIHATFFLLLLWIGAAAYLEGGVDAALVNLAFILALFACVVAHEFGHALMARRFGIATPDITLLPIGGLARLEQMPEKPGQEVLVALAGPAVNVVIWAVLAFGFGAQASFQQLDNIEDPAVGFWGRLAAVNLFLVLFNMIPAFPMDGGRVLRALLAIPMDRVRATRTAAYAGQVIAFVFGFLGLTSGSPILLLIAIFVFVAAQAESSDVAMRDVVRNVSAREATITTFESLSPEDSLATASNSVLRTTQHEFPVVGHDGRLAGLLARNALFAALDASEPPARVADVMERDVPSVTLGAPLNRALDALNRPGVSAVAVTDRHGHFIGYITRENIGEFVVIAGRRH